jgi:hypothetical protein
MSAWIVHRNHIHLLVRGLTDSEILTTVNPDAIGRTLWQENLRSVNQLYPVRRGRSRPAPFRFRDGHVHTYTYVRPRGPLDRDALLQQAHCYRCQSCEHPQWDNSDAARWTQELIDRLTAAGHQWQSDDIPWGWQWATGTAPADWNQQAFGAHQQSRRSA